MTYEHSYFESSLEILEKLRTCIEKAELPFFVAEDEDQVSDLFFWKGKFYIDQNVETPYSENDFKLIKYWNDGQDNWVRIYFKNGERLTLLDDGSYEAALYKDGSFHHYSGMKVPGIYRAIELGIQNNEFVVVDNNLIEYNGHSESLTIPEGITRILDRTFSNSDLKEVHLPKSLCYIGSFAFAGSEKLEHLDLNEGLKIIDDRAFMDCQRLKNITLPSTLKRIERLAFHNTGFKSFESIPEGCKISSEVFE